MPLELRESINVARVIAEHKTQYILMRGTEEFPAVMRGKFYLEGYDGEFPRVGDFVEYEEVPNSPAVITAVRPRTSVIARKSPQGDAKQIIVTNVDVMFIVMGLDNDYNIGRLERYLTLARESGTQPVIVLNKADSVPDVAPFIDEVKALAPSMPVHAVSALTHTNLDSLLTHITPKTTAVLLGSSGAGKSTITNWFLGTNKQATKSVREDDSRGRHTTSHRELFRLPQGGFLIDTPGMRELSLYEPDVVHFEVFAEFEDLMNSCQYSDCDHEKSEGCEVKAALLDGRIDARKYARYMKLKKEAAFLQTKIDDAAYLKRKNEDKKFQAHKKNVIKRSRDKYSAS